MPLRLACPLARTTRTRNDTETDFPIESMSPISDIGSLEIQMGWRRWTADGGRVYTHNIKETHAILYEINNIVVFAVIINEF